MKINCAHCGIGTEKSKADISRAARLSRRLFCTKICADLAKVKHGRRPVNWKHGMGNAPIYQLWFGMRSRCETKSNSGYYAYGARGIKVCDRWQKFENFYADMGPRPEGMSLDRINNDGDYCPENCRWATRKEQAQNRRNNVFLTLKGETKCMSDWAKQYSISPALLWLRLKKGMSLEKALSN